MLSHVTPECRSSPSKYSTLHLQGDQLRRGSSGINRCAKMRTSVGWHLGGVTGLLDVIANGVVQAEGQVRTGICVQADITHISSHHFSSRRTDGPRSGQSYIPPTNTWPNSPQICIPATFKEQRRVQESCFFLLFKQNVVLETRLNIKNSRPCDRKGIGGSESGRTCCRQEGELSGKQGTHSSTHQGL